MVESFLWSLPSARLRRTEHLFLLRKKVCAITVLSPQKPIFIRAFQIRERPGDAQAQVHPTRQAALGSRTVTARRRDTRFSSCGTGVRARRRRDTAEDKPPCSIKEGRLSHARTEGDGGCELSSHRTPGIAPPHTAQRPPLQAETSCTHQKAGV